MSFRSDESINAGKEFAERYLISNLANELSPEELLKSKNKLLDLLEELGPVVDAYPSWHPIVSDKRVDYDLTSPSEECGYFGLDHSVYFVNGFITCPYNDGQLVIDSVNKLKLNNAAEITAEELLDVKFYNTRTKPIVVRCKWSKSIYRDGTIPLSIATPLMLENELPCWTTSKYAETWETMRPYFLGQPCGKRSSLFINQETGQALKKIWESLINTGMYGSILTRK